MHRAAGETLERAQLLRTAVTWGHRAPQTHCFCKCLPASLLGSSSHHPLSHHLGSEQLCIFADTSSWLPGGNGQARGHPVPGQSRLFLALTKDTGCHRACGLAEAVGFQGRAPHCASHGLHHIPTPASLFQNVSFCPQNICFVHVGGPGVSRGSMQSHLQASGETIRSGPQGNTSETGLGPVPSGY